MTQNNVGIYASQISGHLYGGPYGAYDSLATVTLSAATSTITFAGIPTGYKHLQLRIFAIAANSNDAYMYFNSDSTNTNYSTHQLYGLGSGTPSSGYIPGSSYAPFIDAGVASGNNAAYVIDILDYQNTNKYKTIRSLWGWDANGSGRVGIESNLWMNTSAISSLSIQGRSWNQYSSFALYGVK